MAKPLDWEAISVDEYKANSAGVNVWRLPALNGYLYRTERFRVDAYYEVAITHMAVTWVPSR
jgi:hypothetical protein